MFISKQFLNTSHATHKSFTHTDILVNTRPGKAAICMRCSSLHCITHTPHGPIEPKHNTDNHLQHVRSTWCEPHATATRRHGLVWVSVADSVVWKPSQPTVLKALAAVAEAANRSVCLTQTISRQDECVCVSVRQKKSPQTITITSRQKWLSVDFNLLCQMNFNWQQQSTVKIKVKRKTRNKKKKQKSKKQNKKHENKQRPLQQCLSFAFHCPSFVWLQK